MLRGRRLFCLIVGGGALLACDESVNIDLLPLGPPASDSEPSLASAMGDSAVAPVSSLAPERDAASPRDGSGVVDAGESIPEAALIHHYEFSGAGSVARDSVGGADGDIIGGAQLNGVGGVELDGVDDFVDLPNGLLSSLAAATITVSLDWNGGVCWQRVFDFGSSSAAEGTPASAHTSLFVTPASCPSSHLGAVEDNVLSLMFHTPGNYSLAQDSAPLPANTRSFVALSVASNGTLQLSVNGRTVVELASALRLSDLEDVNNWLGRSQWGQDPTLRARLYDARIYDVALTSAQLTQLFEITSAEP
jgi:Concanavalin A-like lectin/glucanases superfamily